ncbi:MarR family winged helix-turn-helix transcriptional regulator [Gilvimarinus sp. F26214L]|uniref:MarR family winged helix-turn-helix transcriptional regulator n=1 Tax=Gilvimarinus sp. DZF01 TaxID=3461371 RepID=UPI004046671D
MSLLNLDLQVCHALYSSTNALVRAYRPLLEPLGLTYPQYLVMMSLWERDGVSIRHLSRHTRLDAGTLTPILKRLEAKGLLRREHSKEDERQKQIVLSKEGKELKARAEQVPETMACRYLKDLDKARKLRELCEELYQTLEQSEPTSGSR